ncbi:GNAT family N-acetyltransferase [Aliikangiella marina]|uniref:GNAT family N-acetyltransferase n=1 Tax=Aliikangiella marina TaxID=1712262 RepID=A0A545T5A9_9GAMM|nr:GNAT family N-acetyltransferase [Aliikangiella marina]TQV72352.1 GNAT family N-acetyltransferase [Aliikangiella marina]
MDIRYRRATKNDLPRCIEIRGLTNDNALDKKYLASIGVTEDSWTPYVEDGTYIGHIAQTEGNIVGFCFGDTRSGEILVLAILAGFEGSGIGQHLLSLTGESLFERGHNELWLAAAAKPIIRAYGFYRRIGWRPTNKFDINGDEILKLKKQR